MLRAESVRGTLTPRWSGRHNRGAAGVLPLAPEAKVKWQRKSQAYIKLQVPAGQANPSPPVGPALGQHGVNIMEFCKAFNAQTQSIEPGLPTRS
jgi:hypothetical protein